MYDRFILQSLKTTYKLICFRYEYLYLIWIYFILVFILPLLLLFNKSENHYLVLGNNDMDIKASEGQIPNNKNKKTSCSDLYLLYNFELGQLCPLVYKTLW